MEKARYWCAVLYPENLREDWEEVIGDILGYPYAYCIHNQDVDKVGEHRKDHVHLMICYPAPTTQKAIMNLLSRLNAPGQNAFNSCQTVNNVRHMYDYLIHDTETCRKRKKHLYDKSCRKTGNNFDIGNFEQISQIEKSEMLRKMCDFVIENQIYNFADAYAMILANFEEREYFDILSVHSGLIDRLCRGNFKRMG